MKLLNDILESILNTGLDYNPVMRDVWHVVKLSSFADSDSISVARNGLRTVPNGDISFFEYTGRQAQHRKYLCNLPHTALLNWIAQQPPVLKITGSIVDGWVDQFWKECGKGPNLLRADWSESAGILRVFGKKDKGMMGILGDYEFTRKSKNESILDADLDVQVRTRDLKSKIHVNIFTFPDGTTQRSINAAIRKDTNFEQFNFTNYNCDGIRDIHILGSRWDKFARVAHWMIEQPLEDYINDKESVLTDRFRVEMCTKNQDKFKISIATLTNKSVSVFLKLKYGVNWDTAFSITIYL